MNNSAYNSDYITQTDLLQREGWTLTIIKKLNFQPDLIKPKHLYGRQSIIKLFSIKDIE